MKVFFVNPPFKSEYGTFSRESRSPSIGHGGALYYPLWLIYAAAVVEKEGFNIEFLDAPANRLNEEQSLNKIDDVAESTRLFVLNTSTPSIYSDVEFGAKLKKKYPDSAIALVGTHPSALPEETLKLNKNIDVVAKGEFDYIIRDLAYALREEKDLSGVKGIVYRKGKQIIWNEPAEHIANLDEIPFAAKFIKEHLDYRQYFFVAATYPEIQMFTGRGCPAQCNFCVYPQTLHGHKYRLRTPENVIEEMQYIADNFLDVKEIVIEDDTFTINKERVKTICELMIQKGLHKRFKWLCNARVNLDYDTMVLMKKAGCRLIIPGIESSDQEILNNIKKGITVAQIKEYVKNAKKAGLLVHACYMVGNMGETRESMERTLELALELNTDTAQFYPLQPYPGTVAYQWAKENGYLLAKDYADYCNEDGSIHCVIGLPGISSQDMMDFCAYARKKYYLRLRYIAHRLWVGMQDRGDLKRSLKAFKILRKSLFNKKVKFEGMR